MCVNVIRVCVYLQNWSHVISYVNKATATPDFSDGNLKNHDHQTLLTRLHCAYGLAELAMRKYKSAAKRFLDANLDYCDIPDLMSTQVHISHELLTKLRKGLTKTFAVYSILIICNLLISRMLPHMVAYAHLLHSKEENYINKSSLLLRSNYS